MFSGKVSPFQLVNEIQSMVKVLPVLKLFILNPVLKGKKDFLCLKLQDLDT